MFCDAGSEVPLGTLGVLGLGAGSMTFLKSSAGMFLKLGSCKRLPGIKTSPQSLTCPNLWIRQKRSSSSSSSSSSQVVPFAPPTPPAKEGQSCIHPTFGALRDGDLAAGDSGDRLMRRVATSSIFTNPWVSGLLFWSFLIGPWMSQQFSIALFPWVL